MSPNFVFDGGVHVVPPTCRYRRRSQEPFDARSRIDSRAEGSPTPNHKGVNSIALTRASIPKSRAAATLEVVVVDVHHDETFTAAQRGKKRSGDDSCEQQCGGS